MDTTHTTDHADDHEQPRVLLTVEAAAARLSISRSRMYALLKTGDVTSVRVGRLRRILASELDAFTARLVTTQHAA
jgi:excisionase family DNA binding protein